MKVNSSEGRQQCSPSDDVTLRFLGMHAKSHRYLQTPLTFGACVENDTGFYATLVTHLAKGLIIWRRFYQHQFHWSQSLLAWFGINKLALSQFRDDDATNTKVF